jgi:hypothetical protein
MSKAKSKARAIARARRLAKPVAVPKVDVPVAPAQVAILAEEEKPTPFTFWAVPIDMMNMWLGVIAPNQQQRKGGDALALHHPLVVASSKETPRPDRVPALSFALRFQGRDLRFHAFPELSRVC